MSRFGKVVSSEKDFMYVGKHRVSNEKRVVLFSSIYDKNSLMNRKINIGDFVVHASMERSKETPVRRKRSSSRAYHDRRKSYHGQSLVDNEEHEDLKRWGSLLAGVNRSANCRECSGGGSGGGVCVACGRGMIGKRSTISGLQINRKPPPKDELLEFLRGSRRPSKEISAVAYRQSIVVRDDGGFKNLVKNDSVVSGKEVLDMLNMVKKNKENFSKVKENVLFNKKHEKTFDSEKVNSFEWLKKYGSTKLEKLKLKKENMALKDEQFSQFDQIMSNENKAHTLSTPRKSCLKKTSSYGKDFPEIPSNDKPRDPSPKTKIRFSKESTSYNDNSNSSHSGLNVFENIKKLIKSPQKIKKKKGSSSSKQQNNLTKPLTTSTEVNLSNIENKPSNTTNEQLSNNKYFSSNTYFNKNFVSKEYDEWKNEIEKKKSISNSKPQKINVVDKKNVKNFKSGEEIELSRIRQKQKRSEAFQELSAYLMY